MGRMRLVFVNRFFWPDHSATSQLLSDLAFHLAGRGLSVSVVTSRLRYDAPNARLPAAESVRDVRVHRVWTTRFGRGRLIGRAADYLSFYLSASWRLFRVVSPDTVVVAATDPPLVSLVAAMVARLRGAVLVNWCHDLFPEVAAALGIKLAGGPIGKALQRLRNASLRRAACNVVLGERMADRLIAEGVPRDRVRVIHNWADGAAIRPAPSAHGRLRRDWGLAGKFVVGYAGNLGRAHDVATMLDAATALRDRDDVVFLFVGGGARFDRARRNADRRGLGNVLFRPYQPRDALPDLLTLIDLHVVTLLPALEGLIVPSKFYGIAAAGRPTLFVGDPDGEIPRILMSWDCGFAVGVADVDGAAAAIQDLASNADRCDQLGSNARQAFDRHFSMQSALDLWFEALSARTGNEAQSR